MYQHKELAAGRWKTFSFLEQMANIGSEIERAIKWRAKGNADFSQQAFFRALELIDLTIEDEQNRIRLKEIARVREALADHFSFDNSYNTTDAQWSAYFTQFAFAARVNR